MGDSQSLAAPHGRVRPDAHGAHVDVIHIYLEFLQSILSWELQVALYHSHDAARGRAVWLLYAPVEARQGPLEFPQNPISNILEAYQSVIKASRVSLVSAVTLLLTQQTYFQR